MKYSVCFHGVSLMRLCFECQLWIAEELEHHARNGGAEPVQLSLFPEVA